MPNTLYHYGPLEITDPGAAGPTVPRTLNRSLPFPSGVNPVHAGCRHKYRNLKNVNNWRWCELGGKLKTRWMHESRNGKPDLLEEIGQDRCMMQTQFPKENDMARICVEERQSLGVVNWRKNVREELWVEMAGIIRGGALKSRDLTTRHHIARVDIARLDNTAADKTVVSLSSSCSYRLLLILQIKQWC